MRIIGLIGGLSWESTVAYYCQINQAVQQRLGGLHSARLVLYSVDFHDLERHMQAGEWDAAGGLLAAAARALEAAGAQAVVLCTNTLHKVASHIEAAVGIPLLHIVDATADEIVRCAITTVGLLGTRFTMEQPFYRERLVTNYGLKVLTPGRSEREVLHRVIFEELCLGRLIPASREACRQIMQQLVARGAEAIILGCTELSGLIATADAAVPLFDTTAIHARTAAEWSLSAD
jgi:amino-acid racemase